MSARVTYAVAMSGGVDSSTAAALIQGAGNDLFGITMNIHEGCSQAIEDAGKICKTLGIEHFVIDLKKEFKEHIIEKFVESYAAGETPNPCALCNRDIKMNLLLKAALGRGADLMATGHYVNLSVCADGQILMKEAKNPKKDQSYFLSLVSKENLKYVRFPLGNIESKDRTRKLALEFGLHNFQKKDSQDICFILDNDYKTFLRNFQTNANLFRDGNIILDETGEILGRHNGTVNYTIGQRRGLGVSYRDPLYVRGLEPKNSNVIVGTKGGAIRNEFLVDNMNWLMEKRDPFNAFVKLRSIGEKTPAVISKLSPKKINVKLESQCRTPITPGQVCAIYSSENFVIGAGIIMQD